MIGSLNPLIFLSQQFTKYLKKCSSYICLQTNSLLLPSIQELQVINVNNTEKVALIQDNCANLRKLVISDKPPSSVLIELSKIKTLTNISVWYDSQIPKEIMLKFGHLQGLELRDLGRYFTNNYIALIVESVPELRSFGTLDFCDVKTVLLLKQFKKLKQLKFQSFNISELQMRMLTSHFSYLSSLSLNNCRLDDHHMRILSENISNLDCLNIKNNLVSDKGIMCLLKHTQLKSIAITFNQAISQKGILFLFTNFKCLRQLEAEAHQFSSLLLKILPNQVKCLEKLCLTGRNLSLSIEDINIFFQNMFSIKQQKIVLSSLKIEIYFNNQTAQIFSYYQPQLKTLTAISNKCRDLNDKGGFYLSRLRQITHMRLIQFGVTVIGIMKILRNLQRASFAFSIERAVLLQRDKKQIRNIELFEFKRHLIIDTL